MFRDAFEFKAFEAMWGDRVEAIDVDELEAHKRKVAEEADKAWADEAE